MEKARYNFNLYETPEKTDLNYNDNRPVMAGDMECGLGSGKRQPFGVMEISSILLMALVTWYTYLSKFIELYT